MINTYRSVSEVKSACLAPWRALKLSEEPSQALSSPYQQLQRQPLLNDGLLDLLPVKVQSVVILITAIMYKQRPGVIQQCQRQLKKEPFQLAPGSQASHLKRFCVKKLWIKG